ncbi:MAG: DUF4347 domain-containing protein [Planctomycetaceae bacterium]
MGPISWMQKVIAALSNRGTSAVPARLRMTAPLGVRQLEERRVLNADPALVAAMPFVDEVNVDWSAESATATDATSSQQSTTTTEVLFIDPRVENWQQLVDGVPASVEVHLLDPQQDALTQIAATLEGRTDLSAIHIVSHGQSGLLQLGETSLTNENLADHSALLGQIGATLAADGDILLYGCNVGAGARGSEFLQTLSTLTQADVAASDNLTGAEFLGGDWVLEVTTGEIEASLAVSMQTQVSYAGVFIADATVFINANGDAEFTSNGASDDDITISFTATHVIFTSASGTIAAGAGANVLAPNSVSVLLSSINDVTGGDIFVNTFDGNDSVTVTGTVAALGVHMHIDGGTGFDTITFTGDVDFGVDQSLTANGDTINVDTNVDITTSGSGSITLTADRSISLVAGATLTTEDGDLTLLANQAGTTMVGTTGVQIAGAGALVRTTGAGDIIIRGRGGDDAASANHLGVLLSNGGSVQAQGGGNIEITGVGGVSSSNGGGVAIDNNTSITANGGNITIHGTAVDNVASNFNTGVRVYTGATVSTTGAGDISITGFGGEGATGNRGVVIYGATVEVVDGNLTVTGTGGDGSGNENVGITLEDNAVVRSTGTGVAVGLVTLNGTGGTGTDNNIGVYLLSGSSVQVVDAGISITGVGGAGATDSNRGIVVVGGATIVSTGITADTQDVFLSGTGGGGTIDNAGVDITGTNSAITVQAADLSITGYGATGTGGNQRGVLVYSGGAVRGLGSGDVTITGTGGAVDGNSQVGVFVYGGVVSVLDGDLVIEGQGGGVAGGIGGFSYGVGIGGTGAQVVATGSGNVSVTGTGGLGTGGGQDGVFVVTLDTIVSTIDGDLTLIGMGGGADGDAGDYNIGIDLAAGSTISSSGAGNVRLDGTGGRGTGIQHDGIQMWQPTTTSPTIQTTGTGGITLQGVAQTSTDSFGIRQTAGVITTATGTGGIDLVADSIALTGGTIDAGAQQVTVRQLTAGQLINLGGTDSATELGLTDAELGGITAATLVIGEAESGTISITGGITRSALTNMELVTAGSILFDSGSINTAGGTLLLDSGDSPEVILAGTAGVDVTVSTLSFGSDLAITINGTTVDVDYTQLSVVGMVDLNGVTLVLDGTFTPMGTDEFVIVDNDDMDAVVGTFNGLGEGSLVYYNGGLFTISYVGGDGNDVVLTGFALLATDKIFVNDDFIDANGFTFGTVILDADPNMGGNQTAVVGVTAFATIQAGVDAVDAGGVVYITDTMTDGDGFAGVTIFGTGVYNESVSITKSLTLTGTSGISADVVITFAGGNGIHVNGADDITIENLSVVDSGQLTSSHGILIENVNNTATLTNVAVTGSGDDGIHVSNVGEFVAQDIIANGNNGDGMEVDTVATDVTLSGTNQFSMNGAHGLLIANINGMVDLSGLTTSGNTGDGVHIETVDTVTIASLMSDTNAYGLFINSAGDVQLSDSSFSSNTLDGASISMATSLTLSGLLNSFDGNGGNGLTVSQVADVDITDSTANNNAGDGFHFTNVGDVVLDGVIANGNVVGLFVDTATSVSDTDGQFKTNTGNGMTISSVTGAVTLTRTTMEANAAFGFEISDTSDVVLNAIRMMLHVTGGSLSNVTNLTLNTTDPLGMLQDTVDVNTSGIGGEGHLRHSNSLSTNDVVAFDGVTTLNVNTFGGADVVNVAAHSTTELNFDGGDPSLALGGDVFHFVTSSPTITANGSGFDFATTAHANVFMENFEDLSITGAIVFAGTAFDDTLDLMATGIDTANFTLTTDGVLTLSGSMIAATSVQFDGSDGDDLLVIDQTGLLGGLFQPIDGIVFNGGSGGEGHVGLPGDNPTGDALRILGGTATSVDYVLSTANNDGTITYNGNATANITFTDLEDTVGGGAGILDTISAMHRTFTFNANGEIITISDQTTTGRMTIDSNFGQQVTFVIPTETFNVLAGDGNDTIIFDSVDALFLAAVELQGEGGADEVRLNTSLSLGSGGVTGSILVDSASVFLDAGVDLDTTGGNVDGMVQFLNATLVTMNDSSTITAGTANVEMTATGDILLSRILSADNVCLTTAAGAIVDNRTTDEAANITAASILLQAATGIGTGVAGDDGDIDTATVGFAAPPAMKLAAVTESGDINIQHTGQLLVTTVKTLTGVVITDATLDDSGDDHISLVASERLTVAAVVSNHDGGNIVLRTTDVMATGDVTIGAAVTVTGGTGMVDIDAGDSVAIHAALTTEGGDVDIDANADITSIAAGTITTTALNDTGVASGSVALDAGLTVINSVIDLAGGITTAGADFTGGIASNAGDIALTANHTSGGTITIGGPLNATGGDGSGGGQGGDILLQADGAISQSNPSGIVTSGGSGAVGDGGSAGTIGLTSDNGGITVQGGVVANGGMGAVNGGDGGAVTVLASGAVLFTAGTSVQSQGGNGTSGISGDGGNIQITSQTSTVATQSLNTKGGTGATGGDGGSVEVQAADSVTLATVNASGGQGTTGAGGSGGTIDVTSDNNEVRVTSLDSRGGLGATVGGSGNAITLNAATDIVVSGNTFAMGANGAAGDGGAGGHVSFTAGAGVSFTNLTTIGGNGTGGNAGEGEQVDITAMAGGITGNSISANGGNGLIGGNAGDVTLMADGDVHVTGPSGVFARGGAGTTGDGGNGGQLLIDSANGGITLDNANVNGSVGVNGGDAGSITLTAAGEILLTTTGTSLSALGGIGTGGIGGGGGVVSATSDNGGFTANQIVTSGGSGESGGNGGMITLTAANDVTILSIVTSLGGQGSLTTGGDGAAISITSIGGAVAVHSAHSEGGNGVTMGGNGGDISLIAHGAVTVASGLGTNGGLATAAGAQGGHSGDVLICSETAEIAVQSISTNGGTAFNGFGGDAGDIILDNRGSGADIVLNFRLMALGGIGNSVANAGDDGAVVLLSGGAIVDGDDSVADVLAGSLQIVAESGVAGTSGLDAALEVDVRTLGATTETGNIVIVDNDAATGLARLSGLVIDELTATVKGTPVTTTGVAVTDDAGGRIDVSTTGAMTVNQRVDTVGDGTDATIRLSGVGIDLAATTANVTADGGDITIDANTGNLNMVSGSSIESDGANHNITIATDSASLASGASISAVGGTVTIAAETANRNINLGGGGGENDVDANSFGAGSLNLNDAELDVISASQVNIGTASASAPFGGATTGIITVTGGISATSTFATDEFQLLTATDVRINSTVNLNANGAGDFDVIAGRDITQTGNNADVTTGGDGFVHYTADRLIAMNSGTSITTVNGDITLTANEGGTTTGTFVGITLTDADIATGTMAEAGGAIFLNGTGGNTGNGNTGVLIQSGSSVQSQGAGLTAGTVTIEGIGGPGVDGNQGVVIDGSSVSSVDGNIEIDGDSQGTGEQNRGINVLNGATIASTGTGDDAATIVLVGNGSGSNNNQGIRVADVGTAITSVDGDITLTGTTDGSGDDNEGVLIASGGKVASAGTTTNAALVQIFGHGNGVGTLGHGNEGVQISGAGSLVTSVVGDISITGESTASGVDNDGVTIDAGGVVSSTGNTADAAVIMIVGTARGTNSGRGVEIAGAGSAVQSEMGQINIAGIAEGVGTEAIGVDLHDGGVVKVTGDGTIQIVGTGGDGTGENSGVLIRDTNTLVSTGGGLITIQGFGGTGGADSLGVGILNDAEITSDTGNIVIEGTAGHGAGGSLGILIDASRVTTTGDAAGISLTGTGGDGPGDNNSGVALLSSTISTAGAMANLTINGIGGGSSGDNSVGVRVSDSDLMTADGGITITGTAFGNGSGMDGVLIENNSVISADGDGDVTITGTSTTMPGATGRGVAITSGSLIEIANGGTGEISITGIDGAERNDVAVFIDNAIVQTDNTQITITGINQDVVMQGTAEVRSSGGDALIQSSDDVLLTVVNLNFGGAGAGGGVATITADVDTSGLNLNFGVLADCVGEIVDNLTGEGANITAESAVLRAGSGIGNFIANGSVIEENRDLDVEVNTLAAVSCTGDIFVTDSSSVVIATLDGLTNGVQLVNDDANGGTGDILIRATNGITIDNNIINAGSGSTTLAAGVGGGSGQLDINANITNSTSGTGGGAVRLVAVDDINLNDMSTIDTNGGNVELHAGQTFHFNDTLTAGSVDSHLTMATDTRLLTDGGNAILTATGNVLLSRVDASVFATPAGTVYVVADSDRSGVGEIIDNHLGDGSGHENVIAASLSLRAATGIGATGPDATTAIDTRVNTVAALTDSGSIKIDNRSALTIGTVAGSAFSLSLTSGSFGEVNSGEVEILSGISITDLAGTGTDGQDSAADAIAVQANGSITVQQSLTNNDAGNITLHAIGGGVTFNASVVSRDDMGTFAGTVRVAADGSVTQSGVGAIRSDVLGVQTTSGVIDLLTASNDVNQLAMQTAGEDAGFNDVDGFHLNRVTTESNGMFDVPGLFNQIDGVNVGAGTVRLVAGGNGSSAAENSITQDGSLGGITAGSLGVRVVGGDVLLDPNGAGGPAINAVDQFAASVTEANGQGGSVQFSDVDDLIIGTVGGQMGFTATIGIDVTNNVLVCAGGSIDVRSLITTRNSVTSTMGETDTVRLHAGGDITQSNVGVIRTATLGVIADGNVLLGTAANDVDVLAVSGDNVVFRDSNGLMLGSVSALGCFNGVTGATADNLTLCLGDDFAINAGISVTGTIRLDVAGDVTQTATVTATSLGINATSGGKVTLALANDVDVLAISTDGGTVTFNDVDDLTIDFVAAADCFAMTTGGVTGVTTPGAAILLTTGGDLTIDDALTTPDQVGSINADRNGMNAGTATVTVVSGGAIIDGSASLPGDNSVDIVGNTVSLTAENGIGSDTGLLSDTGDIEINAATLSVLNKASGNVQLSEENSVAVNTIVNAGRLVVLQAGGSITDATPVDGVANITAGSLALKAGTGIGTTASDFDVDVNTMSARSTTGPIVIESNGPLQVTTVAGQSGVSIDGGVGEIDLQATNGSLTIDVNAQVTNNGSGFVQLTATGATSDIITHSAVSSTTGDITLSADQNVTTHSSITTISGNVLIDADKSITTNGTVTTTGGDVTYMAGTAIDINAAINSSNGGDVLLTAGHGISIDGSITTGGGDVTAMAGDNITTSEAVSSGNGNVMFDVGQNIVTDGSISAGDGFVKLTAVDAITTNGTVTTTGGDVTYMAGTAIDINAAINSSNGGDVLLTAGDGISIDGTITTGGGDVAATAGDDITTTQAVSSGNGNVMFDAGQNIVTDGSISAGDGFVKLTAVDAITTNGTVTTTGGDVTYMAGTAIDINAAINSSNGGDVLLTAGDGISIDGSITTGGGDVTAMAGDNITTSEAVSSGNGNVMFDAGQNIVTDGSISAGDGFVMLTAVEDIETNETVTTSAGEILFDAGVDVTVNAALLSMGGDVSLLGGQDVTTNSTVTSGGGDVLFDAGRDVTIHDAVNSSGNGAVEVMAGHDILLDGAINSGGGPVTLLADRDVQLTSAGDITSQGGAVVVRADADGVGMDGEILMDDGSLIDAGSGTIQLRATDDITLGGLRTTNASPLGAAAVTVVSTQGGIVDGGDTHLDIDANSPGALTVLQSATGIGRSPLGGIDPLETNLAVLRSQVTGSGDTAIVESDSIELRSVKTADGFVMVMAQETILATSVDTSATDSQANGITLIAGDDILVGSMTTGGVLGDVQLTAGGQVLDTARGDGNRLVADDLIIRAFNMSPDATGAAVSLETRVNDLSVVVTGAGRGDIDIQEFDNINLASSDMMTDNEILFTSNGEVRVKAGGSINILDSNTMNEGPTRTADPEIVAGGANGRVQLEAGNNFRMYDGAQIHASQTTAEAVYIEAKNDVRLGNLVEINTGNGVGVLRQIAPRPEQFVGDTAFFLFDTILTPTLFSDGGLFTGVLSFDVGVEGERGLRINIDWSSIQSDRFQLITGVSGDSVLIGPNFEVAHSYTIGDLLFGLLNGRINSSDPIPVLFSVSAHESIVIRGDTVTSANGLTTTDVIGDLLSTTDFVQSGNNLTGFDETPFENGGGKFGVPALALAPPPLVERPVLPAYVPPPAAVLPEVIVAERIITGDIGGTVVSFSIGRDEYLELRVISPDPDAAPLAIRRLPDEFLAGKEGASFTELFNGLPDGTYQIWYVLGSNRRMLVHVDVRNGEATIQSSELDGGVLKLEELREELSPQSESTNPTTSQSTSSDPLSEVLKDQISLAEASVIEECGAEPLVRETQTAESQSDETKSDETQTFDESLTETVVETATVGVIFDEVVVDETSANEAFDMASAAESVDVNVDVDEPATAMEESELRVTGDEQQLAGIPAVVGGAVLVSSRLMRQRRSQPLRRSSRLASRVVTAFGDDVEE